MIGETARSSERRKGLWRFSHRRVSLSEGAPAPRRFYASVATLAVLAVPLIIALTRTFVLVIIGMSD